MSTDSIQNEELVSPEMMEAMGISQPAYEEVMGIIGRMPTVQELSTLLAMWEANGKQQSLYDVFSCGKHILYCVDLCVDRAVHILTAYACIYSSRGGLYSTDSVSRGYESA